MDNGKFRLWHYRNTAIVQVYTSCELTLDDVNLLLMYLCARSKLPFRVIFIGSDKYRMSFPAKIRLRKMDKKYLSIAFVVKGQKSMDQAFRASRSYLGNKKIYICESIETAYNALNGHVRRAIPSTATVSAEFPQLTGC